METTQETTQETPLRKAIDIAGSESALARAIGITPQAVNQWVKSIRPIPLKRASAIEKATGIKREQLRPDIFR